MTQDINDNGRLWTLKEVAARLRVSERTMHNLLNSGEIEGMVIARRWKFTEQAIRSYEQAVTRKSGKGAKKKRAYHRKQAEA